MAEKVFQRFNKHKQAWVKMKTVPGKGVRIMDVKQRNPKVKFKL